MLPKHLRITGTMKMQMKINEVKCFENMRVAIAGMLCGRTDISISNMVTHNTL